MAWLLLALSLVAFYFSWSVRSPLLMITCMLAGCGLLAAFAWLRYKALFPNRMVAMDDTPLSVEEARQMHAAARARPQGPAETRPLPAASHPSQEQMRAAAQRVAQREADETRKAETLKRAEDSERRAADAEARIAEMERRLAALQSGNAAAVAPAVMPVRAAAADIAPLPVPALPAARPAPVVVPDVREAGWNPYAGEVRAPAKPAFDPKAAGVFVPVVTPLRDGDEPHQPTRVPHSPDPQ